MGIGKKNKKTGKTEPLKNKAENEEYPEEVVPSNFNLVFNEIQRGIEGRNKGIPMGFHRLNRYIGIRKSIYFLIGGQPGSGKTAFIDDAFVLNPFDWYFENAVKTKKTDIKLHVWYRSMERKKSYKLSKWLARKIFIDTGIELQMSKLLGWFGDKLNEEEVALVKEYETYMDEMEKVVEVMDGAENPVGVAKELNEYALRNGKVIKVSKYRSVYVPNDPNLITIVVIDHIGLLRGTKGFPKGKAAIDKMSSELQHARDFFGFTIIVVSQFNRSISNPIRIKQGDVEPMLEDFKESGSTQEDADVVLALFDPIRYKVEDYTGYDLEKLIDSFGGKFYRSMRLIKNSYGEDDIRVGLAFMGAIGMFKEMPKLNETNDGTYEEITSKSYFLS